MDIKLVNNRKIIWYIRESTRLNKEHELLIKKHKQNQQQLDKLFDLCDMDDCNENSKEIKYKISSLLAAEDSILNRSASISREIEEIVAQIMN